MEQQKQLEAYIYAQLQSGVHPEEITQQLRGANWDETLIQQAFTSVQSTINPSPAPQTTQPSYPVDNLSGAVVTNPTATQPAAPTGVSFQPPAVRRGKIKTAWLLLKQSIKVLKNNKQLIKYPLVSGILSLFVGIIFALITFLGGNTFVYSTVDALGREELGLTAPGMALAFVYYVLASFIIFLYNAALTAHTLDIFRGKTGSYSQYMKVAWSKKLTIFVYSLITATVGILLRMIEQRSRLLGYLVSKLLGALWALANLFTIAIIVESDASAPKAIKQSTKLFLSRWGESIAASITFGGLAFLFYLLVFIPVMVVVGILSAFLGVAGFILFALVFIVSIIAFAVVESAASNILRTALYYFARYEQIPASFSAELLNSAFVAKKNRRKLFGKKS